MNVSVERYALTLDLIDDEEKIVAYELAHTAIWPEVREHLFAHGVLDMQIYRLGTRLFMVMDVDAARYSAERMAKAAQANEAIVRWESLMWNYQAPTPWTPSGEKWVPMRKIFQLS